MAIIDNLVSYYSLEESSGNATDAHGSTTLTDINTVTSGTGIVSNGRVFTAASFEYLTSTSPPITSVPVSVSFWYKPASIGAAQDVVAIRQAAGNANAFGAGVSAAGKAVFSMANAGSTFYTITGSTTLSAGTWYYIACVARSTTDRELYVNGASEGTSTDSATIASPTLMNIGRYFSGNYANGTVDEVGCWSRAIGTDEISWLYNAGAGRSYADIVAGMGAGVGRQRLVHGGLTRGRLIQ